MSIILLTKWISGYILLLFGYLYLLFRFIIPFSLIVGNVMYEYLSKRKFLSAGVSSNIALLVAVTYGTVFGFPFLFLITCLVQQVFEMPLIRKEILEFIFKLLHH